MQRVNQTIYNLLRAWLPEEVEIYPCVAAESAKYPYCVFNADSFQLKRTKDGVYAYVFNYSINLWGCTFNQVDRLMTEVIGAVESDRVPEENPDYRLMLVEGSADYLEGAFVQGVKVDVTYKGESG